MILNMTGKGGGGTILVSDTLDAAGGTIRTITAKKVVSLQTKTITPTSSTQTVNPDSGYDGFSQVIVNAGGDGDDFIIDVLHNIRTETWETSCTFAEAKQAYLDGKNIACKFGDNNASIYYDSGDDCFYFIVTYETDYVPPSGKSSGMVCRRNQYLIFNSEGIEEDGYDEYILTSGLIEKTITANGTYDPIEELPYGQYGYSSVTVNVPTGSTINNQNKTVTPSESQQSITADSGYTGLGTVTVNGIPFDYVGSGIDQLDSSDLTVSGATVTVPAGYYENGASKSVATMTLPTSAASSATSGYTSKATIGRSTAAQYINIPSGYNSTGAYYVISAVANGSVTGPTSLSGSSATITTGTNTITLTKTGVSTTPTVSAGYVSSATASTATVALTASVTVNPTPTASGATVTIPAGYYSAQTTKSVTSGSATAPSSINGTAASVSTGTNTLTLTKTVSVTPTVSAGYVSAGTAGNSSVSLTASVTTKAAATITPTTTNQTIAAGTYLTGIQTIAGDADLVGSNILSTANIFGVQGTVDFIDVYIRSTAPTSSVGSDGDIYIQE